MKAFDLLDSFEIGIFLIVDDQFQQGKRLIKCNLAFGGFAPNPIHDITLDTKQRRENIDDDRSLTVFGKPENYTLCFVQHD